MAHNPVQLVETCGRGVRRVRYSYYGLLVAAKRNFALSGPYDLLQLRPQQGQAHFREPSWPRERTSQDLLRCQVPDGLELARGRQHLQRKMRRWLLPVQLNHSRLHSQCSLGHDRRGRQPRPHAEGGQGHLGRRAEEAAQGA